MTRKSVVMRILAVVAAVILVAAGVFLAVEFYLYSNPEIELVFFEMPVDDSYFSIPVYTDYGYSIFGESRKVLNRIGEASNIGAEMTSEMLRVTENHSLTPYELKSDVKFKDGSTVYILSGYYTDSEGNRQDYYKEWILDFILTKKITYPESYNK